jgi:hypothetical protein
VEMTLELGGATVAGLLSLFPGIGAAIQSLADGRAKENLEKQWLVLFSEFKTRIEEIRSSIPDEAYYGSHPGGSRSSHRTTVDRTQRNPDQPNPDHPPRHKPHG